MNMKKFLLSILCCLLVSVNIHAVEVTKSVTFSNYPAGTQYANNEKHDLGDGLVIYTTKCHFTSELRIYSSASNNGFVVSDALPGTITEMTFNAGNKADVLQVYGSNDGNTWTLVGNVSVTSTAYKDYSLTFTGNYSRFKLDVKGSNQIRLKKMSVTYTTGGSVEPPKETVATPVISPASTTFNKGESVSVSITTETEGATIHYTTNGAEPTAESTVFSTPFEVTETTTVKAIAVKEGWNNSEVAETTYTAIDPNATNYKIVASEQGYGNGEVVTSLNFGVVTATFASNGGNSSAYYNTGSAIRAYAKNTITFTGAVGITITEIKFTFATGEGTNAITVNPGTFSTSTNTWTGASNEVKFTIGGTGGHRRIATIEVAYAVDGNTVVIATPSITTSTSFVGSTTVEVTNNEAGTTLYYSTNGEDYAQYTGALTITETTTVSAYSQDAEGNKSSVAEATFTKIEVLTIAEAKATYDNAGSDVDVAVDLTGAVVTVNSGQYLFIENETTGINLYNSGANYAVGTKFTAGYILGKSTVYGKMHQITGAEFKDVETTTVAVEPTEVEIADIKGNNPEYEGRFVKLSGVSIDVDGTTITQGEDTYALYNRFALELTDVVKCDVEGIVAIYNTKEQLYITKVTPAKHTLHVTGAGYATLFLDYATVIPTGVKAYAVTEVNNGYVSLNQIEDILPANTGVIVEAVEGDYDFVAAANNGSAISGNKLLGTTVDTDIDVEAYVLSMVDDEVGLYKAEMNGGVFLNNANKAYLPASAVPAAVQGASGFKFRVETTGVEQVEVAKGVKAIYDLSGRKVNDMKAPGLYIVNGKKVLVK